MPNAIRRENNIEIENLICFDPALTLDCGQAFRWSPEGDGFVGVAGGKVLRLAMRGDTLVLYDTSPEDYEGFWRRYFDLDRDYSSLCKSFSADASLREAVSTYPGIRILRQEPWEALCSFIISQNNNIPRIKGIIDRLCRTFGDNLGGDFFSFPPPGRLAGLTPDDLSPLRAGFRAKYILDAAHKTSSGEISLDALASLPMDEARAELMRIRGVGPKVAECVLLYGCGRMEAFPVDVWVKRIMSELYPDGLPDCVKGCEGAAQQYLFHWRRNLDT